MTHKTKALRGPSPHTPRGSPGYKRGASQRKGKKKRGGKKGKPPVLKNPPGGEKNRFKAPRKHAPVGEHQGEQPRSALTGKHRRVKFPNLSTPSVLKNRKTRCVKKGPIPKRVCGKIGGYPQKRRVITPPMVAQKPKA